MTSVLILTQKAEVKVGKLQLGTDTNITFEHIQTHFKKKIEPEILGTYDYKGLTLFLIGFVKGRAGTENKHELPPPHDSTVAFGDIMLIASKHDYSFANPVPFKVEDYELFYSRVFGGEDDDDEEDEKEEEEEEEENEVEIEEEEEAFEKTSYASEEEEEVVFVKKEKKKKASLIISNVIIHPDKQLQIDTKKNDIRQKTLSYMSQLFNNILSEDECEKLEHEIYKVSLFEAETKHIIKDWSIKLYHHIYMSTIRKIVSNLYPTSYVNNVELLQKYKNKEITLEEIASMNHYAMFESKWRELIEHQQNIEKRQLEGNKSMATDQFLCTRCFKRECTYYEMQTRSADEPMTIFINCLNCGKNWRQ